MKNRRVYTYLDLRSLAKQVQLVTAEPETGGGYSISRYCSERARGVLIDHTVSMPQEDARACLWLQCLGEWKAWGTRGPRPRPKSRPHKPRSIPKIADCGVIHEMPKKNKTDIPVTPRCSFEVANLELGTRSGRDAKHVKSILAGLSFLLVRCVVRTHRGHAPRPLAAGDARLSRLGEKSP